MVAFINGGSRGIGAAMVRAFCAAGYQVAFTYERSKVAASALYQETGAFPILADSSQSADVYQAVALAEERLGGIDVLINNAAISRIGLITDLSPEEWEKMLSVNVSGYFHYCRAVLPGMVRKKQGRIINISSMWGVVGASCEVAYSTTKAAIIGLTKALAKEVGPSGITVNAIAPGVILTEMNASLGEETLKELAEAAPLGRIGLPEEVAELALFLAGKGGDFITGQVLLQDGGFANS